MSTQATLFDIPVTGVKRSRRKAVDVKINRVNRELSPRRYYLHRCLGSEFELISATREIKAPYKSFEAIPVGQRFYIGQLLQLGYKIQYELL